MQRDRTRAHPPLPSSLIDVEGRWVDVETAAARAASDVGMAVVGVDRWHRAVFISLRTDADQPASLLVGGRRRPTENLNTVGAEAADRTVFAEGSTGVEWAEARVGRLGAPEREAALLVAFRERLAELAREPRLPSTE